MPRAADPEVRAKLLTAATELLAAEGRGALSTRRLAAAVGTSTMAVYTYFGSMDRLQHEVRRNGFARLCAALDAVPHAADPVAGVAALVLGYVDFGSAEPLLYRAIFTDREPTEEQDEGSGVFDRFLAGVGRCIDAGRFQVAEPILTKVWAAQLWLAAHGPLTAAHTGLLSGDALRFLVTDTVFRLAIGYGDDPAAAESSVRMRRTG